MLAVRCSRHCVAPARWAHVLGRRLSSSDNSHALGKAVPLPSVSDLEALCARLENEARAYKRLPAVFIDAMVPRQRLVFGAHQEGHQELHRIAAACGGEVAVFQPHGAIPATRFGVTAELRNLPADPSGASSWQLVGRRHVCMRGHIGKDAEVENVEMLRLELLEDEVQEADVEAAKALPPLVEEWQVALAKAKGERFEGQLRGVLSDLGPMPAIEAAGDLAFWVAGLVNPLPGLGVALEIRPAALAAPTIADRVQVVRNGIEGSIGHLTGLRKLF